MIQFNLLPDVKIQFIKATRTKRLVIMASILSSLVALFIMISLFLLVNVAQKEHLNNLSASIKTDSKKLQDMQNLSKILTVQNQLVALDGAHNKKPVTTRLANYLELITPSNVNISTLSIDFIPTTLSISGRADQLTNINKFVDTLKFTKYSVKGSSEQKQAFDKVVLSSFGRGDKETTYSISLVFDPLIFDAKSDVTLVVPKITTTRSEIEKPAALFQQPAQPTSTGCAQ